MTINEEREVYLAMKLSGPLTRAEAALFRTPLASLVSQGLVRARPDGGYETIVAPRSDSAPPPPRESMATLTLRAPASIREALDRRAAEHGTDRSAEIRDILAHELGVAAPRHTESGTRPAVRRKAF